MMKRTLPLKRSPPPLKVWTVRCQHNENVSFEVLGGYKPTHCPTCGEPTVYVFEKRPTSTGDADV